MKAGGGEGAGVDRTDGGLEEPENNHHHQNHRYDHHFFRQVTTIALLFGVILVTCSVLYRSALPFQFLPTSSYEDVQNFPSSTVKLKGILEKAATRDKTVIVTTLNEAWAAPNSIFDLFLESFRIGNGTARLLNHLVIIGLDRKAYDRCLALHPHCYLLGVDFSGGEAYFMSTEYLKMMWRRIQFLYSVLELGYNFIFTDADIMWFRNPFGRFEVDGDFQIACDYFGGNASDLHNSPNGGFTYVRSNERTIQFYKFWYTSRETYPGLHDQDVLNKIKFNSSLERIGLKMRFLDTAYFGGFCQPSRDLNQVCTMHANCCFGLKNKVHDLKVMLQDWKNFSSPSDDVKASQLTSWTVPQKCLHSYHPPDSH